MAQVAAGRALPAAHVGLRPRRTDAGPCPGRAAHLLADAHRPHAQSRQAQARAGRRRGHRPRHPAPDPLVDVTRAAMTAHLVHLTFDDGPDRQWTPRVLDALAAAQASATFFVIGRQAQRAPELLRRMLAEGHEVGNHTFSHRHPWTLSRAAARAEVLAVAAALAALAGRGPGFFRPPPGLSLKQTRPLPEKA
ncbi:MAG: hypothetical protein DIU71_13000, partial [Proteobacteria bacterium]